MFGMMIIVHEWWSYIQLYFRGSSDYDEASIGKESILKEDVDYFVFHQANKFMLNTIRKVCVLPKEKFYINLENTGNTVSSTVLIGLKHCMENGTIHQGMTVMVTGFGVGLSWAGTMLSFNLIISNTLSLI